MFNEIKMSELVEREYSIENMRLLTQRYEELLFAVRMVYPGETRHETALRHIIAGEEAQCFRYLNHVMSDANDPK